MSHDLSRCSDRKTLIDLREILRKATLHLADNVQRTVRWCGTAQWYELQLYWVADGKAFRVGVVLSPLDMRSTDMVRYQLHRLLFLQGQEAVNAVELRIA